MANKDECDAYAAEAARRFDEFVSWATINWPRKNFPLVHSDFGASRRELSSILGARLHDAKDTPPSSGDDESAQYIDMNPAPWP